MTPPPDRQQRERDEHRCAARSAACRAAAVVLRDRRITCVAEAVAVRIGLVRVRGERTVIRGVRHPVTIEVVAVAAVARIAEAA